MAKTFKLDLPLRGTDDPEPSVADPLKKAEKTMGMLPNMYGAMANLPGLLETYSTGYESFRSETGFSSQEQEVILLTISRFHECHYCMAAHSFLADKMSNVPQEVTDAIRTDKPVPDERLEALRSFTRTMVKSRGMPAPEEGNAFLEAGFEASHVLGIILAIATKTISNYTNHLFDTEVDPAFAERAWSPPARD